MEINRGHLWGDIQLLTVALIWGLGYVAAKIGLQDGAEPFFLMALRFSTAVVSIFPIFIIHSIKTKKRMQLSTLRNGILLGMLNFLEFFFQTIGLRYTTISNNAVLIGVNVIIVPFLVFLLTKRKVKPKSILAAFFTLIGIGILSLNEEFAMNNGDLLSLVAAVMLAFHITITGIVAKDDSSVDLVLLQMMTGAILSVISTFVFKEVHAVTAASMLVILYLGIFCTMLAFLLQTIGQRHAHATQAAMILSTESLFGPIFAILILGEALGPRLVIGGAIIFAAIFLSEYEFKSSNKSKE